MTWRLTTPTIGAQAIADVSTTQNHPWGTIVWAVDPTFGAGEFIYLKGVTGGLVGLCVYYVATTGVTSLTTTSGVVNAGNPIAVMVSLLDANTDFGWCQIGGDATIKKTAVKYDPALNQTAHLSATAGRIMQTSVASRRVLGARFVSTTTVTSTTSTAVVNLQRPHQQSGP